MRQIPQVDKLLRHPRVELLQKTFRRDLLVVLIREEFERLRSSDDESAQIPELGILAEQIVRRAEALRARSTQRVINGTGVVLHTNLGRAPLAPYALAELNDLAGGYSNLEIDLDSGERGKRSEHVGRLLSLITGAEAAVCVNNNAAAVVLCVNTFARSKEVIVSRGELIEIGGSFRLPEVITAGGARLKEVGTTNRTRASDYEKAIGADTGLIVRCHRSNFDITGFTEQPALADIVAVGKKQKIVVLEDLGSGVLIDIEAMTEFRNEPTVREVVATGCDIVSFSGDKLLGGPQAGIIVGQQVLIDRLAKNPLYRALRLDKVALHLLESTLAAYLTPNPEQLLPALSMLSEHADSIRSRVQQFAQQLKQEVAPGVLTFSVVATQSAAGGGSLPGQHAASHGLKLEAKGLKPGQLALKLRRSTPPVVGMVKDNEFILDFRTITEADCQPLLATLRASVERLGKEIDVSPKIKRI